MRVRTLLVVGLLMCNVSTAFAATKAKTVAKKSSSSSASCVIKGNISSSKEKIFHVPGCASYKETVIDIKKGERWFCTEADAKKAGWRKAKNC